MSHSFSISRTSLGRVDLVFLLLSNLATDLMLSVSNCDDVRGEECSIDGEDGEGGNCNSDDDDDDDDSENTDERDDALDENLDGGEDDKYSVSSSAGFRSIPIGSALYFVVEIGSIFFPLLLCAVYIEVLDFSCRFFGN